MTIIKKCKSKGDLLAETVVGHHSRPIGWVWRAVPCNSRLPNTIIRIRIQSTCCTLYLYEQLPQLHMYSLCGLLLTTNLDKDGTSGPSAATNAHRGINYQACRVQVRHLNYWATDAALMTTGVRYSFLQMSSGRATSTVSSGSGTGVVATWTISGCGGGKATLRPSPSVDRVKNSQQDILLCCDCCYNITNFIVAYSHQKKCYIMFCGWPLKPM